MEYGLIGKTLGHSFSPEIHGKLAEYEYKLYPLNEQEFAEFMQKRDFKGMNVTIPYKQAVMEYCDEIDPLARKIGAVNTLVNKGGKLIGYNTDCGGFIYMLRRHKVEVAGKTVLVLGNGASTKTILVAMEQLEAAQVLVASRRSGEGTLSYEQAMKQKGVQVVVNCSPAGMYPENGVSLVDLSEFPLLEAAVDLVYNPLKTAMLLQAEKRKVTAVNGLEMLVAQAKYAAELFTESEIEEEKIEAIRLFMVNRHANAVLIGMPGCGKTSLGKKLAKLLDKTFVDLDHEIVKAAGKPIPVIFAEDGEDVFRNWESKICEKFGKLTGQVISTGGGVVKRSENIAALRQNGVVLYIKCSLDELAVGKGRPLSQERADLEKLYAQRAGLYKQAADAIIRRRPSFKQNPLLLMNAYKRLLAGTWEKEKPRPLRRRFRRPTKKDGGKTK